MPKSIFQYKVLLFDKDFFTLTVPKNISNTTVFYLIRKTK